MFRKVTAMTGAAALAMVSLTLSAQEATESAAQSAANEMTIDWVKEIINGGMTSLVLLLLSAAAIGFFVERIVRMRRKYFVPAGYVEFFRSAVDKNDTDSIRKQAESAPSILADAGTYIVDHADMDPLKLQTLTGDNAAREIERHRQRCYPLAIVATMAPMLGLLGTVIGMIEAFSKIAILGDTGDAAVLADSISKALITTDMGLVLAIPALGAYHYLKHKLSVAELEVEEALEAIFLFLDDKHGRN